MREKYESLSLAALKDLAKARGLKGVTAMRKAELIEVMLEEDEKTKPIQEEERDTENETEKTDVVKQTRPENRENNRDNIKYESPFIFIFPTLISSIINVMINNSDAISLTAIFSTTQESRADTL